MKTNILLLFCILFATTNNIYASDKVINEPVEAETALETEQTCGFSLQYTTVDVNYEVTTRGTVYSEGTVYATVLVNCKQTEDKYVTVAVYVNGKHVGSGVVTIPAGALSSESTSITIDTNYLDPKPSRATLKIISK